MDTNNTLRAVVIGAGWAGEGHTLALRSAGVEVVALCGRSPKPTEERARQLAIPAARLDWRKGLEEFQPEIVAIATPGNSHCEMALAAAEMGCHILCDKPLGLNTNEAQDMLDAVTRAGVKHAYASTTQYDPTFAYANQLIAVGEIGQMWQAEYISHWLFPQRVRFNWVHQLSTGGGYLNNVFTHGLGQILRVTGAKVRAATGLVTQRFGLTPVGAPVHDFREIFTEALKDDEIIEWKEPDADVASITLLRVQMPDGGFATVLFQNSCQSIGEHASYSAFYGTKGTLRITFGEPNKVFLCTTAQPTWQEMPIPQTLIDRLPAGNDNVQRHWNQLACEFVADIRGEGYVGYPTFADGWVACEVIDSVRSGNGWMEITDPR